MGKVNWKCLKFEQMNKLEKLQESCNDLERDIISQKAEKKIIFIYQVGLKVAIPLTKHMNYQRSFLDFFIRKNYLVIMCQRKIFIRRYGKKNQFSIERLQEFDNIERKLVQVQSLSKKKNRKKRSKLIWRNLH